MALYSYKLSNALSDEGLQVTLFVDAQYELDDQPARFIKAKVLSSGNIGIRPNQHRIVRAINILVAHLLNWYGFYRCVRKERPQILHIQSLFYLVDWYMLGFFKRINNAKLVLTVHDVMPHKFYTRRFGRLELAMLQYMYDKADRLIVHAETNKQQLLENFSVDKHKVVVIPHGEYSLSRMSQEISESQARSILDLDDNQKVILFFGYIRKTKGIDILLKAFDRVAERFPGAVLVISGSVIQGESFSEYGQIMCQMKYKSRVKCLIEYIEHQDIPVFFRPADIVVLPYLQFHSQSGVLHLAQGFGKAVIVTNVGGLPEVVEDQTTGLIVPPGDVDRLAWAMTYLLENEELRTEMGRRAKKMAMERFSWNAIAKATIEKAYS
ncbi:MAG: hypothetical protein BA861_06990 [Desulfobacterales bacterium S3730MH5]|nr:MAG: hypothetical protein BA861_06990 [Desulfobacterales bacterium S3730MH5]OEU78595.1 MAG: hypothetical protein BA873_10965 [Desulfobulbaceae bacterium C00003063]